MPAVRVPDLPEKVLLPDACHRGFLGHLSLPMQRRAFQLSALRMQVAVLVVGAGPTGLGAATRLQQHGLKDWLLIDKVSPHYADVCSHLTAEAFPTGIYACTWCNCTTS